MWPFIIIGLVSGSIYGLAALGLVVTYKTSGVFNFAHGALAAVGAYIFYTLHVTHGLAWPLAAAIVVFIVGPIIAIVFEALARALGQASIAVRVSSTVGVLLAINAVLQLVYGITEQRTVPTFLAQGQFSVGSTVISYSQLTTVLIAVASTAALYVFFKFTRSGTAMRAVVERPDLLEISGTSAVAVRRVAWLIGTCLVTMSGVLLSTLLPLDVTELTLLVVQALGAAALASFTSIPIAFVGGLVLGVAASLATKYFTAGILAGVPSSVPFIILLLVLLIFPKRYLQERSFAAPLHRPTWTAPGPIQLAGAVLVVGGLALVPTFAGIHLTSWTTGVADIILFLSLGLLVRAAGQVSLGHITFVAIGVTAFGHLAASAKIPWLLALVLAFLIATPIGALLAIPAIRLSPLYLALATFGFGIFVQYMFYGQNFMFGSSGAGTTIPRPGVLGLSSDRRYYYLVLVVVVAVSIGLLVVERSRFGRLLRAMADSPVAVATSGVGTQVTWILAFALSAGLAAVAGALSGGAEQIASATSYPPLASLTYLALVVIVVGTTPWYAVLAGLSLVVIPSYLTSQKTGMWMQLIFGVFAVLYALTPDSKRGLPVPIRDFFDRLGRRDRTSAGASLPTDRPDDATRVRPVATADLEVRQMVVRFGGLVAVNDVSLTAQHGVVTGLIGPNGAGKSTLFNACSGLVTANSGEVRLGGRLISRLSPAQRAQAGLGRTFQQIQLFDALSVWENVAIATEGALSGRNPVRQMIGRRRDREKVRAATAHAIAVCGLEGVAATRAGDLSTGKRRLVELARCIAGPFSVLLLDEPASGLDHNETLRFGEILRQIVAEQDVAILLVEHDMSLVMSCCQYIYVVDFGTLIFEGTPSEVVSEPVVRAAYLGEGAALDELLVGGSAAS